MKILPVASVLLPAVAIDFGHTGNGNHRPLRSLEEELPTTDTSMSMPVIAAVGDESSKGSYSKYNSSKLGKGSHSKSSKIKDVDDRCEELAFYFPGPKYCDDKPWDFIKGDNISNKIGYTYYETVYGPPDATGNYKPIGIKYGSSQNNAVASQEGGNGPGFYALSAGFLLDPTGTVGHKDTIYESSIVYQGYAFINGNGDYNPSAFPVVGGTGKYACAKGEFYIELQADFGNDDPSAPNCQNAASYHTVRVCDTCPKER